MYTFTNVNSGKPMEVEAASTDDGANVQQWSENGGSQQRWIINDDGNVDFTIENANSGQLADVEGGSTSDGVTVLQWPDNGGANQRWTFSSA